MTMPATLSLTDAARQRWDALVIGAGLAGATTARELARLGIRVLLVDRVAFPRAKVCGCCLLQTGLSTLTRLGLGDLPTRLGAIPLTSVRYSAREAHARIPLTGGVAISRESLDAGLIEAAIAGGAQFLPETSAKLHGAYSDCREVTLRHLEQDAHCRARIIIAADGLGSQLVLQEPGIAVRIRPLSRIGAGCLIESELKTLPPGEIEMACGKGGYIGLVRLGDNRICCAAALELSAVRQANGPGGAAVAILNEAGVPAPQELAFASWRGTPPLTRSLSRHWANRLLVVGDAAGYFEPFTGQGMSTALSAALALAPVAARASESWSPELGFQWDAICSRVTRSGQSFARATSLVLRRPRFAKALVALMSLLPFLATPFERRLNNGH